MDYLVHLTNFFVWRWKLIYILVNDWHTIDIMLDIPLTLYLCLSLTTTEAWHCRLFQLKQWYLHCIIVVGTTLLASVCTFISLRWDLGPIPESMRSLGLPMVPAEIMISFSAFTRKVSSPFFTTTPVAFLPSNVIWKVKKWKSCCYCVVTWLWWFLGGLRWRSGNTCLPPLRLVVQTPNPMWERW